MIKKNQYINQFESVQLTTLQKKKLENYIRLQKATLPKRF